MNFDKNIRAELIWDGTDEVRIPSGMFPPMPDQMQGTAHDRLGELSCRICYDSMGLDPITGKRKGRTTDQLHEHILLVRNHNVYEHADFTFLIRKMDPANVLYCMVNRPGVWCELTGYGVEVTMNHRAVLEWDEWTTSFGQTISYSTPKVGAIIWNHARTLAPKLYPHEKEVSAHVIDLVPKTEKLTEKQASVSLYLAFSRGCGNEQCRHRFRMSQRSTRFCDESESCYVQHPLLTKFLKEVSEDLRHNLMYLMKKSEEHDKKTYMVLVEHLQEYLVNQGVEKTQARKQARGAARGYLGLALHTEMIFTATVKDWRWMLSQRASALADGEIRVLYSPQVLQCLKSSQYGHFFEDLEAVDAPDGIGQIVVKKEEARNPQVAGV